MSEISSSQPEFSDFYLPFGGKLDPENRWIKLANLVPWDVVDAHYRIGDKVPNADGIGTPALPSRVAFGAMVIKERLGCTDEETVEQISENPYLQFFLGYTEMLKEPAFDPSMMVHFRKRFKQEDYDEINLALIKGRVTQGEDKSCEDDSLDDESSDDDAPTHSGKLLIDATAAPADITYPTDLKLLNTSRETLEVIIDVLHEPHIGILKKPRTYRKVARREYLEITKLKKVANNKRRASIRKQLGYIKRNLEYIDQYFDEHGSNMMMLTMYQCQCLITIHEIYRQQSEMWENKTNRIDHRIVSLSQPWVRPIVRGKQAAKTEFGAKISISVLADGYVCLDRLEWNAYNEGNDLIAQAESYKEKLGYWPDSIHADKIYVNRLNRAWCKERGIRLSGPPLGRPKKVSKSNKEELKAERAQRKQDGRDRNPVEGKIGNGKRKGTLNRIMAKLQETSVSVINIAIFVLNLDKKLAELLFCLIYRVFETLEDMILELSLDFELSELAICNFQKNQKSLHF